MDSAAQYAVRGPVVMLSRAPRTLEPERLGDHFDRLYRAAWALCGSREDAEDLVQETYARVLRKPRLLRSDDDLGYLLRVLRNTYFSTLRTASRRARTERLPDEIDQLPDTSVQGPFEAVAAGELYGLIAGLPEPFRDAVVAVDLIGLSYREAAQALRVREATLTTRLYRARLRLARELSEPEANPTPSESNTIR